MVALLESQAAFSNAIGFSLIKQFEAGEYVPFCSLVLPINVVHEARPCRIEHTHH